MNSEPPQTNAPSATSRRCDIQIQNPCRYPEAGARRVRPWLEPVVSDLAPRADSMTVRFVSDREMRRLNATYRQLDKPTDVLSFPGDLDGALSATIEHDVLAALQLPPHLGDVVVSIPTARRQAERAGHGIERELRVLLLHGVLHCLGHDHETDDGQMERLERRLRQRYVDDD